MRDGQIYLAVMAAAIMAATAATAAAEMPLGFYAAMSKMENVNVLCVKNYEAGATFTEVYTDFEHLEKDTAVVSRSLRSKADYGGDESAIEASINSNIIGKARISWASVDPRPNARGQHAILARDVEDTVGVFSIEKFIQLWSNSSHGGVEMDWIPCL